LISAKVIVLTIVAFEWKSAVNTFFEGQTDSLVRFFGIYYSVVGVATIAIQVFVTGTLLKRRNLSLPILLMPVLLLVVSVMIICSPIVLGVLVFATLGKSIDAWRRSVHDTTLNFLYTRIRRGQRRLAISVNSGLVKPLSEVAAAITIFFGSTIVYRSVLMIVLVVWIFAAFQLIKLVKPSNSVTKVRVLKQSTTGRQLIQT
jgi:ATP/ADP translocase